MVSYFRLGWWFAYSGTPYERDCYLILPLESQTTNVPLIIDTWVVEPNPPISKKTMLNTKKNLPSQNGDRKVDWFFTTLAICNYQIGFARFPGCPPVRAARHGLEAGKAMKYWNRQQPQHRQCHFLLLAAARLEARLEASMGFLATLMLNFKQLHVAKLMICIHITYYRQIVRLYDL